MCRSPGRISLVVSCWAHLFGKSHDGIIPYSDNLNRWALNRSGKAGKEELRERLAHAFELGQTIRVVFVRTDDTAAVEAGTDAGKIPNKTFYVKKDWIGKVSEFDGAQLLIEFKRRTHV